MISIKQINEKDIDLCYELDSNTISLWSKKQWYKELKKEGINVFALVLENLIIGIFIKPIIAMILEILTALSSSEINLCIAI